MWGLTDLIQPSFLEKVLMTAPCSNRLYTKNFRYHIERPSVDLDQVENTRYAEVLI